MNVNLLVRYHRRKAVKALSNTQRSSENREYRYARQRADFHYRAARMLLEMDSVCHLAAMESDAPGNE